MMQKVEINAEGRVACPRCGYECDADSGETIYCENCDEKFVAVSENAS